MIENGVKVIKQRRNEKFSYVGETTVITVDSQEDTQEASQQIMREMFDLMYLQALCLRRVNKLEEASNIYRKVRKLYLYEDRHRLVDSAFGILLLPLCDDRKKILNALEVMQKYLEMYGSMHEPISRPIFGTYWDVGRKSWHMKFEREIVEELRRRSFFKRFSAKDLAPFLSKMVVRQHKLS